MWNCTFGGLLWLILPFLIGLVTGWWVWAQKFALTSAVGADSPSTEAMTPQAFAAAPVQGPATGDTALPASETATPLAAGEDETLTPIGIPAARGEADDLLQIKGIGPKLNAVLNDIGVVRFDQIAAWTPADIARVDAHLGAFRGRIDRDAWVEQASLLARGLIGAFEARFGKLDSENK